MSAKGVKNFIAAVDLVFPMPQYGGDKARQAGLVALYTNELQGYPDDVLAQVGKDIIRETKPEDGDSRFFPSVAKIRERCDRIMESKRALETPLIAGPKQGSEFSEERIALARDIMQSPLGQQARREGWDGAMFDFCRINGKAPSGKEIEACRATDKKFRSEYERCLRGEAPFSNNWARLAESMVRKARELMGDAA